MWRTRESRRQVVGRGSLVWQSGEMKEEERMWKREEIGPVFIPLEMGGLTPRINISDWSGKTRLVGTDLRARAMIGQY